MVTAVKISDDLFEKAKITSKIFKDQSLVKLNIGQNRAKWFAHM